MAVWENRKYIFTSADKFEEYLEATGFPNSVETSMIRSDLSFHLEFIKTEDKYTLRTTWNNCVISTVFKLEEPFTVTSGDNSIITMDGNKMTQVFVDNPNNVVIHEFSEDQLTGLYTCNDVVATTMYVGFPVDEDPFADVVVA